MKLPVTLLFLMALSNCLGQNKSYLGISVFDAQSALPLSRFTGAFSGSLHPGVEFSKRKLLKSKKKHDWLAEGKAAIFYHRFVQWGLPLSMGLVYRYKISHTLRLDASVGGGYLHSIPASEKFKLSEDGNYSNNKGIGRAQATANLGFSAAYIPGKTAQRIETFVGYNELLQFPFIKSYVPLLPYSQLQIGVRKKI